MGAILTQNDTLRITTEQGFPVALNLETHLDTPYVTTDFKDKIFEFKNKPTIRNYQQPPIRNFLVQEKDGKWIYWGLIEVLEVHHDYINKSTSGKFRITYIYSPEEMKKAHNMIDRNPTTEFFK